ncbi:MAG: hypothetical protein HY275_13555 [Gemmatimonadetes bacterium]|nr:hypothetical protein [Gemmatimonadota bacterium]
MADGEQTYDDARARLLEQMLVALAERIQALAAAGQLLERAPELMRLVGDIKSELFHYEVRITYDSPEVAENRRIVADAQREPEAGWDAPGWTPDPEERPEW